MSHLKKLKDIRQFVKIKIPHNKKSFTTQEKRLITQYYNKLNDMGYFNDNIGFIAKNTKQKVKNAPLIKKVLVQVGTKRVNGEIVTDKTAKVTFRKGRTYIKKQGMPSRFDFTFDAHKDFNLEQLKKHLQQKLGQKKLKKGQYIALGAGIYETRNSKTDSIDMLAREILKLQNRYESAHEFLGRIIVYYNVENIESLAEYNRKPEKKKRKKRKSKYESARGR